MSYNAKRRGFVGIILISVFQIIEKEHWWPMKILEYVEQQKQIRGQAQLEVFNLVLLYSPFGLSPKIIVKLVVLPSLIISKTISSPTDLALCR